MSVLSSTQAPVGAGAVLLPRVNLLPPEILEAARFRRVQRGLGAAVAVAVVAVGVLYAGAASAVSDEQTRLDAATSEQQALSREAATYREVTALNTRTAAAEAMLVQAMGPEVRYSRFLNDLAVTVPEHVWVTSATFTQSPAPAPAAGAATAGAIGTVSIAGVAYDHDDVAVWLETLAAQKGYAEPSLQNATEAYIGTRKVVNWATSVVLTADALSGRYPTTKAGG